MKEGRSSPNGDKAVEQLRPVWLMVIQSLKQMFPCAIVTGRLRPDIYGDRDGVLARDSAGVRVVTVDSDALEDSLKIIRERWDITEVRNYRKGHPRSSYYRGVHIYLRCDEFEIEVQLRTKRQHLIAEWAHDHLFLPTTESDWQLVYDKQVLSFLATLSSYYDRIDHHLKPNPLPPLPEVLCRHAESLGISRKVSGELDEEMSR